MQAHSTCVDCEGLSTLGGEQRGAYVQGAMQLRPKQSSERLAVSDWQVCVSGFGEGYRATPTADAAA